MCERNAVFVYMRACVCVYMYVCVCVCVCVCLRIFVQHRQAHVLKKKQQLQKASPPKKAKKHPLPKKQLAVGDEVDFVFIESWHCA